MKDTLNDVEAVKDTFSDKEAGIKAGMLVKGVNVYVVFLVINTIPHDKKVDINESRTDLHFNVIKCLF